MNAYRQLKARHQEEINQFPMVFAFTDQQFNEAMEKLGFSAETKDYQGNVMTIGGGGIIKKEDFDSFNKMMDRQESEVAEAVEKDENGEGFVFDMFRYELANHEYGYTGDPEDAFHALGLSPSEVFENDKLLHGFKKAAKAINEDN